MSLGNPGAPWRDAIAKGALAVFGLTILSCAGTAAVRPASSPKGAESGLVPEAPVAPPTGVVSADASFDPAKVIPVLDDPRLAEVRAAVDRSAMAEAAAKLTRALASSEAPTGQERAAWLYTLGRVRADAGDPLGAARAFDDATAAGGPLEDYARLRAAELLSTAGKTAEAAARLNAMRSGSAMESERRLVLARSLARLGQIDEAAKLWREHLAQTTGAAWVPVALSFAAALLEHPSETHAEEAVEVARRVIYGASSGQGVGEARALEQRALGTLPFARRARFEQLTGEELLARARSLVSSGQLREALKVTDGLIILPGGDKPGGLACEAWRTRGDALARLRKRPEAAKAYGDAIDRCAGQEGLAAALYSGGRAAGRAGDWTGAIARYSQLERELPGHRYADDARLFAALAYRELGDQARANTMLETMPDAYPEGDMVGDGLFELALSRIEEHDWAGAMRPLQRGMELIGHERAYDRAGRFEYFLGRAQIETGSIERGKQTLQDVVRAYPLSLYMAHAYARLSAFDAASAKALLDAAIASEPAGPFVIPASPVLGDPGFVRATWLVRVQETKAARAELDVLGLSSSAAPPALLWASTFLLARSDEATAPLGLLRLASLPNATATTLQLASYLDHYPSGQWRAAWELAFPRPFLPIVQREATRQGIPEALAYAIMREESAFSPRVTSSASAVGLMQLILPTAKAMAKQLKTSVSVESLKTPAVNVALGCRYLSVLRNQFADNPLLAIPGYNAGGGAPKRWIAARPTQDFDVWIERIPYEETRLYTKRVITSMAAYAFLYGEGQRNEALALSLSASPAAKASALVATQD